MWKWKKRSTHSTQWVDRDCLNLLSFSSHFSCWSRQPIKDIMEIAEAWMMLAIWKSIYQCHRKNQAMRVARKQIFPCAEVKKWKIWYGYKLLKTHTHSFAHRYRLQHDSLPKRNESWNSRGGWLGGPSILATRRDQMLTRSEIFPLLNVCAHLHRGLS